MPNGTNYFFEKDPDNRDVLAVPLQLTNGEILTQIGRTLLHCMAVAAGEDDLDYTKISAVISVPQPLRQSLDRIEERHAAVCRKPNCPGGATKAMEILLLAGAELALQLAMAEQFASEKNIKNAGGDQ